MNSKNKFFENIDKQIGYNKGKNLFSGGDELALKFVDDTILAIKNIKDLDADSESMLIDYATDKVMEEFCRMNQYYAFNSSARKELHHLYNDLFSSIRANKKSMETISAEHYQNLKIWLLKTNSFAEKLYCHAGDDIEPVVCAEYSAELQMEVLKIDKETLLQPVLDIGCGKNGNLVHSLDKYGIEARGLDRFAFSDNKLINSDWLEFSYGIEKWGTIVSNLGFSNQFIHHHLREDGNYIEYGKKYMEILQSLKVGGRFHYAPDLPFIEQYINANQYKVEVYDLNNLNFRTTIITRLK